MKKINLLVILAITLFITSCDKDEENTDEQGPITGELIGTWIGTDIDYSGTTVTGLAGQEVNSDYVGTGYDLDFKVTFESAPNKLISEGTYSIVLTTTVLGQSTTHNEENLSPIPSSDWSRDGNEITFLVDGQEPQIGTIIELKDSMLKIKSELVTDLSQPGLEGTTTTTIIYIFTR